MRSSLLLGAVCAATSVIASPVDVDMDKRAYETEWTAWTVTTSTTEAVGPAPPTDAPAQAVQIHTVEEPPTTTTLPPVIIGAQNTQQPQAQAQPQAQPQAPAQPPAPAPAPAQPQQQQQQQPQQQPQQKQQEQQPQPAPETVSTSTIAPTSTTSGADADSNNILNKVLPTAWTSSFSTAWTSGPTQAPQSSGPPPSGGAAPANKYQETLLYNHNIHRSNHSASSLGWSDSLASSAQKLAARCVYKHDTSIDGGGYGQNIGYGVDEDNIGQMITNLMYNDEMGFFSALYGLASPLMELFDSWGHFSQIVWKSTTEVGCATVVCDKLGNVDSGSSLPFTVCNYNPAGNAVGEYSENVLQPQGHPVFSA